MKNRIIREIQDLRYQNQIKPFNLFCVQKHTRMNFEYARMKFWGKFLCKIFYWRIILFLFNRASNRYKFRKWEDRYSGCSVPLLHHLLHHKTLDILKKITVRSVIDYSLPIYGNSLKQKDLARQTAAQLNRDLTKLIGLRCGKFHSMLEKRKTWFFLQKC